MTAELFLCAIVALFLLPAAFAHGPDIARGRA